MSSREQGGNLGGAHRRDKQVIERMDFRWDQGFVTDRDSYLEERVKLQQELEQLSLMSDNGHHAHNGCPQCSTVIELGDFEIEDLIQRIAAKYELHTYRTST